MTIFAISRKTIAAALLALAAVLFSSTAKADHFYYALVSEHQVPITVAWNAAKTVCTGAVATINAPVDAEKSKLYKVQQWVDDSSQNWFSFSVELKTADIPYGYAFDGWYRLTADAKEGTEPLVRDDYGTLLSSELKYTIDFPTSNLRYYYDGDWYNWYHYKYPVFVGFTPISSEVTFDYNDESGNAAVVTETYDTSYGLPVDPTRVGHTFLGWYTAREGGSEITEETVVTTITAQTLYAHWQALAPTITFDPQDGTVSPASQTMTYGSAYTLPTPTRTGYTFDGWYTTPTGGSKIADEGTSAFLVDQTLYAHWTMIRPRITVNKTGDGSGIVTPAGVSTYDYGKEIEIEATAFPGSHFVQWSDGDLNSSRRIVVTEDALYTATFELNTYTVRFIYRNADDQQIVDTQHVKYGNAATPPSLEEVDQRPKYTFIRWDNNQYLTVTGNLDIYAVYTVYSYKIHYNPNGSNVAGTMPTQTFDAYEQKQLLNNTYRRNGYTFLGWSMDASAKEATFVNEQTVESLTDIRDYTIELYAIWKANSYTVTFDGNGGNAASPTSKSVTYDSDYGTLATCTRTGYTFEGWYTSASGGTKIDESTTVAITADQTLFAHWKAKTYALSYEVGCEGVTPPAATTVTYDSTYSGKVPALSRTGYTFNGWYTAAEDGKKIESTTKVETTTAQTLYAHWTANTYTVYFYSNGGGELSESSRTVTYDSTYGALPTCSRTGYDFDGWYTAATGGEKIEATTQVAITSNQYLYAHWIAKTFAVTTEADNCTIIAPTSGTFDKAYSFSWVAPEDKTGYTTSNPTIRIYRGTSAEGTLEATYSYGTSASYTMSVTYSEALHITGKYTYTPNKYTVEFDTAGGGSVSSQQVTYDAAYGTLPELKKKNHKFCGWWDAEGNLIDETTIVSIAENHTLTAKWERETYTVTFDAAGGEGEMSDQVVDCGEDTVLKANTFTKTGYLFEDWVFGEDYYDDRATVKDLVKANEIATLTAEWTNIVYTIAFDANWKLSEGVLKSEVPAPLTDCKYDVAKKLTAWTPETGGMAEFLGWALDRAAEEPDYLNGEKVRNLTTVGGTTVTLYAVWKDSRNDLTKAVGCDNMVITSERTGNGDTSIGLEWRVSAKGGVESGGYQGSSVPYNLGSRMSATANGPGVLVFKWQKQRLLEDSTASCVFAYNGDEKSSISVADETLVIYECTGDKQHNFRWTARKGGESGVADEGGILRVSYIRWYPDMTKEEVEAMYANPAPTAADAPTISGDFSFATDERFDYVIWKKTDLSEPTWTKLKTVTGNGDSVPLPMFEGTQGFFKVEVIQRKAQ